MGKLQRFIFSNAGLWIVFIVWTLFVTNLWLPRNWGFYGTGDWDLTYSTFEAARISICDYGEWPSYQPFLAFGSDLNANPQAVHGSVFFIPILLFGSFYGYKISIVLAILIGLWGAYKLFLRINSDKIVGLCMALVFCGAPYFSRHVFEAGHSNFLYFYFLPWFLICLNGFNKTGKAVYFLGSVLLMTQCIVGGAPIAFLIFALALFLWSLGMLLSKEMKVSKFIWLSVGLLFSLILSAWKILPVLELWESTPRHVTDDSSINLLVWLQALLDIPTDTRTPHAWHELAIGFPLILLLISVYYIKNLKNYKLWILISLPVLWLGFGNMPIYLNPWYVLNTYVPVFTSLRAPYRIGILSLTIFSILVVYVIQFKNDNKLIYLILIAVSFTQTLSFNAISKNMVFSERIEDFKIHKNETFQPVVLKKGDKQYIHLLEKHLVLNAYEPLHLKTVSDSMRQFVMGAKLVSFQPDQISLQTETAHVKLCMRYSPNWKLEGKGKIDSSGGLLNIQETEGKITITYKNKSFAKGLWISFWGTLLLIGSCLYLYKSSFRKTLLT